VIDRVRYVRNRMPRPRELVGRALDVATGPFTADRLLRAVETNRRAIALTFDDGPSPEATLEVVELLEANEARGTFFVVGERVEAAEGIVERVAAGGHELANHTFHHPHTTYLSRDELRQEIVTTTAAVEKFGTPVRFVRPPFGKDRRRFVSLAEQLDLRVALWSIDSGDSTGYPSARIVATVEDAAGPGEVILFHDHGKRTAETVEACRQIVPALRAAGFDLVTLSDLVAG
jgi:peptidoglycan-N-acetylglucosamine deacetylase